MVYSHSAADGLDTTAQYICRFDDTNVPGTTYVNSPSATNPSLATQINCPIPVWTTGSAATISTKISLWVYENGSPVAQVPHATSVDDTYTLDRCKDGVKNHGETDVDCGGQCRAGCTLGKSCSVVGDCISGLACNSGKCVDGKPFELLSLIFEITAEKMSLWPVIQSFRISEN